MPDEARDVLSRDSLIQVLCLSGNIELRSRVIAHDAGLRRQLASALEAQQKAERERDIAKDHWQGYHADCRIYERDLKAIQEAYAQLLAGKNSGASATVDDANHETLYDAIDRSSQQTPEPEVVPRECLPPSPLLKVYEDPEFQKEWVSALEEPQNISRLIRERDEARAEVQRLSGQVEELGNGE